MFKVKAKIKNHKNDAPPHEKWIYGNLVEELSTGKKYVLDISKVDEKTNFFELAVEVTEPILKSLNCKDRKGFDIYEGDILEILVKHENPKTYHVAREQYGIKYLIPHNIKDEVITFKKVDSHVTTRIIGSIYD